MSAPPIDTPPYFCPLDSAVHPGAFAAERRAVDWIDTIGLCGTQAERARVLGSNSAEFYARCAPGADPDRLWLAVCWVYWGFAFDDAWRGGGPPAGDPAGFAPVAGRVQRALEVPGPLTRRPGPGRRTASGRSRRTPPGAESRGYGKRRPHPPTDPYADRWATALHDLGERYRGCATAVQVGRFQHAHRGWLCGAQWQTGEHARGRLPDLDDYLAIRLLASGGEPRFALLEIANGTEVPAHEMQTPQVRALTEMAVLIAALDEERRARAGGAGRARPAPDVVTVLMADRGLDTHAALREAVALRDTVLLRFLALRERVVARASSPLRHYLADLGHGVRGALEWTPRPPRRPGPAAAGRSPGTAPGTAPAVWAHAPLHGGPDPRRLPSVGWWWSV